jgi:hypothetical protein
MSYKYGKNNAAVEQHGTSFKLITAGSSIALGPTNGAEALAEVSTVGSPGQSATEALAESSTVTVV